MITPNPGCPICATLGRIRGGGNGADPVLIAELAETYAVLHEHQRYEGWSVLLLKEHVEHLSDLSVERQGRVFEDVARVAAAVRGALKPVRLNYECLGNVVAHVHWHIVPRYAWDPEPRSPIWTRPAAEYQTGVEPARREELVQRLRDAMGT